MRRRISAGLKIAASRNTRQAGMMIRVWLGTNTSASHSGVRPSSTKPSVLSRDRKAKKISPYHTNMLWKP